MCYLKGQFVVYELGVFIDLAGTVVILFHGVQYHGGCAPRPRNVNVVIPLWAYRVLFVTYPKRAVYLGLCTYILGSLRTGKDEVSVSLVAGVLNKVDCCVCVGDSRDGEPQLVG